MSRRLVKEVRPLLVPAVVGALAAAFASYYTDEGEMTIAIFAFFGSVCLLATLPFGVEFQQHTLPLLLSQPFERAKLWRAKLLAPSALVAVMPIAALEARGLPPHASLNPDLVIPCVIVLATLCSGGYWTLIARSTVGGIAFCVSTQVLLALTVDALTAGFDRDRISSTTFKDAFLVAELGYAALFLWLGWRAFSRLELRGLGYGEPTTLMSVMTGERWWSRWLRCRSTGGLRNLLLKELRLQQHVFLVGAIYVLLWVVTLVLEILRPAAGFENFSLLLAVLYAMVAPLLAGAVSTGEERMLGLSGWQLTLPVLASRQWLVKLAVGLAVALTLGVVLPALLVWGTAAAAPSSSELFGPNRSPEIEKILIWWYVGCLGLFLSSFWAVSIVGNTVRAVVTALLTLACLGGAGALAVYCADQLGGLEFPLMAHLTRSQFNNSPQVYCIFATYIARPGLVLLVAGGLLVVLLQSLTQFRLGQLPIRLIVTNALVLLLVTFLVCFWCRDFSISFNRIVPFGLEWNLGI